MFSTLLDQQGQLESKFYLRNWKFRNHIPRPGRSETQAVDDRVGPGQTYRYRVYAVFQSPRGMAGSKPSNEVKVSTKKKGDQ